MEVDGQMDLPLGRGKKAEAGPAFITRREPGHAWSGGEKDLVEIVNHDAIDGLVVLDTWVRNRDRHYSQDTEERSNPDNVFLSYRGAPRGKSILKAIDHTQCFSNSADLTAAVATIGMVKDDSIYGFFPAFQRFITEKNVMPWLDRLCSLARADVQDIVAAVPKEWQLEQQARAALVNMICERAAHVLETLPDLLKRRQGPIWIGG